MLVALGKAGELVSDISPFQWQPLVWLNCECGSSLYAPRSQQGHIGKWALCTDINCRKLWQLSNSDNDVVATLDGVMPALVHARMVG